MRWIAMIAAVLMVSLFGLPIPASASEQPTAERPVLALLIGPTVSESYPIFDIDIYRLMLMVKGALDDRDVR